MSNQSQWKTSTGFILASAGSAIGLGAMWKFRTWLEYMAVAHSYLCFDFHNICRASVINYGIYCRKMGRTYDPNLQ